MSRSFHALLQQQPVSLLAWLTRRPGRATVLHPLAAGHGPVTHTTLDRLRPTKVVENLRMHLVVGGALPPRDERLSTFERWLPGKIAEVEEPESRKVLHAYATWHMLRRLRTVSRRRRVTHGQVHGARAYVTQAQLLNWLSSQNMLSACSQDVIDAWLDENPARGPRLQGFLVWTSRKGHTRQLAVPLGTPAFTGQLIAQDVRVGAWSAASSTMRRSRSWTRRPASSLCCSHSSPTASQNSPPRTYTSPPARWRSGSAASRPRCHRLWTDSCLPFTQTR
ncbi:hypothetical protein [Streptomyces avermitilis]|uniref:hypothetical protein n=1 Tax=Streptomyces avermitilis TaxID=33903 RepID=UPI00367BAD7A